MYIFLFILLFFVAILLCAGILKRKKAIKKLCLMCTCEKFALLNELLGPFGYSYCPSQDLITSRIDAWQRDYGYTAAYDKLAYRLHIICDCLPVYFDYNGRTWLIELWKGQYGICAGCEAGVYYSNRIIAYDEREKTIFSAVPDNDMPYISFSLFHSGTEIAYMQNRSWWLTAFLPGSFFKPCELSMHTNINFPDVCSAKAFANGLTESIPACDISVCGSSVSFCMDNNSGADNRRRRAAVRLIQLINRTGCALYKIITKPLTRTSDRILYMYFFLPRPLRRMLNIKKQKTGGDSLL